MYSRIFMMALLLLGRSYSYQLFHHWNRRHVMKMSTTDDSFQRKNVELYKISSANSPKSSLTDTRIITKPEILAPAGGWPQLRAAVANGADAVYFGLQEGFNARARASNFPVDELADVMRYLHERGAKGYLVINVLVFDEEMEKLEEVVRKVAAAGVDALIMQDIGKRGFLRRLVNLVSGVFVR